ncbi:hypothetical protein [Deinococcus kurensis]|uniref:hypothetical protein n=1 Tax=Deinococcus kurensis TaxID=2662757 RepID=UPI0012D2BFD0|nr:hypothetical protein [Deinococcus kurensis]
MAVDLLQLENELFLAVDAFFQWLLSQTAATELYAAGLYSNGELSYLVPTANTRAFLCEAGTSPWSPPDWEFHLSNSVLFQHVEEVLGQGWSSDFSEYDTDPLAVRQIVHRVLRQGRERWLANSDVVVGLFMGESAHPWIAESIRAINPPEIAVQWIGAQSHSS